MFLAELFIIMSSLHFTRAIRLFTNPNPSVPLVQQPLNFNGRALVKPRRVACIGDSITRGPKVPLSESYPSQLQQLLGTGYEVKNFGVEGQTIVIRPWDSYFKTHMNHEALAFLPEVAIVQFGTNDARNCFRPYFSTFERDYGTMIDVLRNLSSKPQVYIMVPPPLFRDGWSSFNQTAVQNVLPPLVRKIATTKGLPPPIDNFKSFTMQCPSYSKNVGRKSYMYDRRDCKLIYDGCHPTAIGYTKIAELVHEAIINSNRTFH
eukprot:gnl/TRDRNA2_/TRDRNA2_175125_c1_seq14.p1 gnl/TRDRNA2_/TRDRNA2_175125_c1~~gnl/TRDRNA2_/TRDRNA2_175125_c1_seq14.p1  ORF type:complete len:262 (+),score=12.34 gnl/TRDRNA2_/TRDRNA2_175125_c1_seq14:31-816(+)